MREELRALVIVVSLIAGMAAATFITIGGPWWAGALVFGAPALVLRVAITLALLRGPHRKDRP